jgi:hypothetical protein
MSFLWECVPPNPHLYTHTHQIQHTRAHTQAETSVARDFLIARQHKTPCWCLPPPCLFACAYKNTRTFTSIRVHSLAWIRNAHHTHHMKTCVRILCQGGSGNKREEVSAAVVKQYVISRRGVMRMESRWIWRRTPLMCATPLWGCHNQCFFFKHISLKQRTRVALGRPRQTQTDF